MTKIQKREGAKPLGTSTATNSKASYKEPQLATLLKIEGNKLITNKGDIPINDKTRWVTFAEGHLMVSQNNLCVMLNENEKLKLKIRSDNKP